MSEFTPDANAAAILFADVSAEMVANAIHTLVKGQPSRMPLRHAIPAVKTLIGAEQAAAIMPAPKFTEVTNSYSEDDGEDEETYTETVSVGDVHFYGYQVTGSIARCGAGFADADGNGVHITRAYKRTTCAACLELLAEDKEAFDAAKLAQATPDAGTEDAADVTAQTVAAGDSIAAFQAEGDSLV